LFCFRILPTLTDISFSLFLQFQNFAPSLIDNFFVPNGNGPIRRSIGRIIDTTGKVVNNVAGMFRSTVGVLTGNL
jgi:hypothetical protein